MDVAATAGIDVDLARKNIVSLASLTQVMLIDKITSVLLLILIVCINMFYLWAFSKSYVYLYMKD